MSKRRATLLLLLAALLLAGALAWAGRDLPRWALERLLAGAVGGRVEIGELAELKPRRLVLRELEIEAIAALPPVETLTIGELRVEASSLRELAAGRFERLLLRGLDVRLVPAPFELRDEPLPFTAGELVLEPATIHLASAEGETFLSAEGTLRAIGSGADGRGATGTLTFRSPELALGPVLALASPGERPSIGGLATELAGELVLGGGATELRARAAGAELKGSGPAAKDLRLELPGLVAEAVIAGGRSDIDVASTAARAVLDGERRVDLGAAGLRAAFTPAAGPPGALRVELFPRVSFLTAAAIAGDWDPGTRRLLLLTARLDGLRLEPFFPGRGIEGDADLVLHGDGERLGYVLTVRPVRLVEGETPGRDHSRRLHTPGARLTVEGEAAFPDLAADRAIGAGNLLAALAGPLAASLEVPSASGHWGEVEVPAAALPLTARFDGRLVAGTPAAGTPAAAHGTASLEAGATGRLSAEGVLAFASDPDDGGGPAAEVAWRWRGAPVQRLLPLLDQLGLAVDDLDALRPAGRLAAVGRLRGPLSRPGVEATVTLEDLGATGGETWAVSAATAVADLRISGNGLRLRSLAATGDLAVPPLGPIPLTLAARGRSDLDLAAGRLDEAVLETPALGRLRLAGDWRTAGGEILAAGRVAAEELEVSAWQQALGTEAVGLALGGRVAAELTGELRGTGAWQLAGPVCLDGAGFSSPFGARVMEGLTATAEVRIDGAPGVPITGRARGRGGTFLLLWDAFFADFSQVEADFEVTASAAMAETEPSLWLRGSVAVPGGPRIAATLERPGGGAPGYRLALDDEDLAATHERYLRQVLRQRFGEAELGGGVSARLRGRRADDGTWTLGGDLRLTDFGWTSASGEIAVAGLDLILPLDLRLPTGEATAGRRRSRLRFDRLALRGLELPPTDSGLWVEGDALGIDEPIELAILNGKLILERLTLRRLLAPGRTLESGLVLDALSLEEISRALEILPLEGTVDGTFPLMRLSADELKVEGGGEIALFGGRVRVREISGEEIFTRFPKLTLSADFQDIDLGRFTRRIDFGEMSGVLEGSITDCELFRGIPVRCRAHFETVHRPGVPRAVDVKAINNLTILGTGAGIGFLDRGIRRFFKRYTYDRLAVDVELDQDVLLLRGLEQRGERELFLRGRLPFPIDVVNAQPGKTVSFQTMLRRLKSLEVGDATRSPE